MKHLTANEAPALYTRLRALSPNIVLGFPSTEDDSVRSFRAFNNITDREVFTQFVEEAERSANPALRARYPRANWPTGIPTGRDIIEDWHSLKVEGRPLTYPGYDPSANKGGLRAIVDSQASQFADEFNGWMQTAKGEGWMFGFSWYVDLGTPGDFGSDPTCPQFHRILMPWEPGSIALRETLRDVHLV